MKEGCVCLLLIIWIWLLLIPKVCFFFLINSNYTYTIYEKFYQYCTTISLPLQELRHLNTAALLTTLSLKIQPKRNRLFALVVGLIQVVCQTIISVHCCVMDSHHLTRHSGFDQMTISVQLVITHPASVFNRYR